MFFSVPIAAIVAAPIDNVDSNVISDAPTISFINLFLQADLIVQSVMLMLLLSSIWSWAIIFDKTISIRSLMRKMSRFEDEFWSGVSLDKLYRQIKGKNDNPLAMIFCSAIDEWNDRNVKAVNSDFSIKANTKERIEKAMQVTINKSVEGVERHISFLATVGSSAPFVGLFGTVWGIMVSFQSIAASKNTTLAVVAPGIAEALMATALGLAAAIPAVIFYNKFASEANRITNKMEDFATELSSIISRELDNQ